MPLNIPYYSLGAQFIDVRSATSGYLHGTQKIDVSSDLASIEINDVGRASKKKLYTPGSNTISIDRIVANYSNDSSTIFSPLLHYIFFHGGGAFSLNASGPQTYKQNFLLNPLNLGYTNTGNASTDLRAFDLNVAYKDSQNFYAAGTPVENLYIKQMLLKSYKFSVEPNRPLMESSSFSGGHLLLNSTTFNKDLVSMGEIPGKNIFLIKGQNYSKELSKIPTSLSTLVDNGGVLNNEIIFGITGIECEMSINYKERPDQGNFRGMSDSSQINLWKTVDLPININCTFKICAQKYFQSAIEKINTGFEESQILLVFKCSIWDTTITPGGLILGEWELGEDELGGSGHPYFVINLGKKNLLTSLERTGGSTSGDLLEYSLTYSNSNNDFNCYFTDNTSFTITDQTSERY